MSKFKPQYRRLLFIDQRLREAASLEQLPNCRTLAEAWETSQKTIQRDLDFLKYEMDAPIEYDSARHGYYYSRPDFVLPAVRILEGDLFAICLAEKVLRQYENTPLHARLSAVFEKLGKYLPDHVSVNPAVLDERFSFFPEAAPNINPEIWEAAFKGLCLGHTLDVMYRLPGHKEAYETRIDAYHVVGYKGEWYIVGRCHYKQALRMFGISRIQKAKVSKDAFQIPADFDFQEMWRNHFGVMVGAQETQVRVRFRPDQAPYVKEREWHVAQVLEDLPDGGVELTFPARHLFEVTRWVLSWGAAATVLAPQELVERVKAELDQARSTYN